MTSRLATRMEGGRDGWTPRPSPVFRERMRGVAAPEPTVRGTAPTLARSVFPAHRAPALATDGRIGLWIRSEL
jgi:hypothetical protein